MTVVDFNNAARFRSFLGTDPAKLKTITQKYSKYIDKKKFNWNTLNQHLQIMYI